ncbi:hypothetical protein IV500_19005 [Paeniglutamicibacter antarcticus]|uniref:Uncharacterized protein n=1 Tax=Arthrobacter terrae TaxID=2935737 RepID=A0A931CMR8_9MICC|nr:hypothetical protein [Arthrobacter terrae]MBG0741457.1 hypothetical protein [Arthrobacter terrae]
MTKAPTSGTSSSADPTSSATDASPSSDPSSSSGSTSIAPAAPSAESTAAVWKTFTDRRHSVRFELPQDWTVQQDADGPAAGAMNIVIKDPDGQRLATLATGISGLGGACAEEQMRPYTVLASIPMDVPSTATDAQAVSPRFVYRLIQGTNSFYASYGITDHAAGANGTACLIYNTVTGPSIGIYMFGDALQLTPGGRTFNTIAEAQKYMLSAEFQNIQRMITSLKITA